MVLHAGYSNISGMCSTITLYITLMDSVQQTLFILINKSDIKRRFVWGSGRGDELLTNSFLVFVYLT